jgi:hypothetical protein
VRIFPEVQSGTFEPVGRRPPRSIFLFLVHSSYPEDPHRSGDQAFGCWPKNWSPEADPVESTAPNPSAGRD